MEFQSIYTCPVAIRQGMGHGSAGLCSMELLDVMTRAEPSGGYRKFGGISDKVPTVSHVLHQLIVWWNDDGSSSLSDVQRADTIWPILPNILGSFPQAKLDTPREKVDFYSFLVDRGLGKMCCGFCDFSWLTDIEANTILDTRTSFAELSTQRVKDGVSAFWEYLGVEPTFRDYTAAHYNNLLEWMDLQEGVRHLREYTTTPEVIPATN